MLYARALDAARLAVPSLPECADRSLQTKPNGTAEVWVTSAEHWGRMQECMEELCGAIIAGWKRKRDDTADAV